MHYKTDESAPVGVVPRRQARSIDSLMSDGPVIWSVADEVETPRTGRPTPLSRWLSAASAFGVVAAVLEWLKLAR